MKKYITKKTVLVILVLAALIVLIVVVAVRKQQKKDDVAEEKVYPVSVMEAGETGSDVSLTYTGMVQPDEMTQCTFETIGTVQKVHVKKGDEVREGSPLVTIDDTDARDQLDSANRTLDYAQKNRDNAQESYDDAVKDYVDACGAGREKDNLEDAMARRNEQQSKVDELKERLSNTPQYKEVEKDEEEENTETHPGVSAMPSYEVNTEYYALQVELESAQNTLGIYQQNVDSAQEAYDKKVKEGAESDEAKAQKERMDTAEDRLDNARQAYDDAQDNVENAQKAVEKCTLKAPAGGYVVDVQAKEGSVSTPIIPAVVLASHEVVVNFGVSQTDITALTAGMAASITVGQQEFSGSIKDIDVVPDETTRTYATNVTVDVQNPDLYLGELATVKINIGERRGIWLPISVILNDGEDYIYVVEEGRAKREYITIEQVQDDYVLVTGTKAGEKIITEGMKTIQTGSAVSYEK